MASPSLLVRASSLLRAPSPFAAAGAVFVFGAAGFATVFGACVAFAAFAFTFTAAFFGATFFVFAFAMARAYQPNRATCHAR